MLPSFALSAIGPDNAVDIDSARYHKLIVSRYSSSNSRTLYRGTLTKTNKNFDSAGQEANTHDQNDYAFPLTQPEYNAHQTNVTKRILPLPRRPKSKPITPGSHHYKLTALAPKNKYVYLQRKTHHPQCNSNPRALKLSITPHKQRTSATGRIKINDLAHSRSPKPVSALP